MNNVYAQCPVLENGQYRLRLVTRDDCEDLLKVYSDIKAVPLFNSDNCHGDTFHYTTRERMLQGIDMWLWSYDHGWFVRWSIIDKAADCVVGTIELFHRDSGDSYHGSGILRLDLRSDYESPDQIRNILNLILPHAFEWFHCNKIATKAVPDAAQRCVALTALGFVKSADPLIGHDGTQYFDYFVFEKN